MSQIAARGTKRVCLSCGGKFYDLNRDPIVCPMCEAIFQMEDRGKIASSGNAQDDDDDDAIIHPVEASAPLATANSESDLPDLEDTELVDLGEDDALKGDADETFIEDDDDDAGDDVSGLLSGPRDNDEET
ncbi:MAG: TIGR02300 family protein [Alphaproteobacteria bacterium]